MKKFGKLLINYVSLYGKSFAFVWRSCPWLCTVLFCTVPVQALLPSASLSVTNRIISSVQKGAGGQTAPLLAAWCAFFVLNNLMTPLNTFLQGQLTDRLTYYMNFKIMEKSKDIHDISYFENSAFYDKISLLGREASWRPVNFLVFGTSVLSNAILLVSMVALLASYYVWIAVVLFVAMLVQGVISYRIQQQAFETLVSSSEGSRKLSYYSEVTLTAESIKDVRLYNLYTFFEKKYNAVYEEIHAAVQKNRIRQFLVAAAFLVVSGCFGAFCFSTVIDGVVSKTFEIGAILIFTTSILYCVQGITSLVQESSLLYDTLLYMENLFGYLNLRDDSGNGDLPVPDNYREIVFDRLSFTYPNAEKPALSELTFRVKKGEKIAIVGENGAGKSTLVKLLMRLYPTGEKALMLDDTPIRTLSVTAWQKRFAAVFQDFARFDLTLAENVMLSDLSDNSGCAAADSPRFADALERGGVDPAEFGVSPEQMLGLKFDGGRELSGGQWQRIALSRAFYANADILVLDEPASALDPRMEKFVFDKFYELSKDKTVFFITHRLASVRRADKILLLQNGKLAGFDSHEKLLANNAYYAELYHMQADLFA